MITPMPHGNGAIDDWTIAALREFGDMIRELRRSHGWTQRALARRCGVSQSTISRLEAGLAPGMGVVWVARLLAAMQKDLGNDHVDWRLVLERELVRRFAAGGTLDAQMAASAVAHSEWVQILIRERASSSGASPPSSGDR